MYRGVPQNKDATFNNAYRIILLGELRGRYRDFTILHNVPTQCSSRPQADCGDDGFEFSWR